MSQENVEMVRRALTEFAETQQLSELVAPNFVWDLRSWAVWPGQPEFHGHDGFMEFFAEWIEPYEEWTQDFERFIDVGESQVVVATVQHGHLRDSDSWVELRAAFLYTAQNGLMTRAEVYSNLEDALEAAGLQG